MKNKLGRPAKVARNNKVCERFYLDRLGKDTVKIIASEFGITTGLVRKIVCVHGKNFMAEYNKNNP